MLFAMQEYNNQNLYFYFGLEGWLVETFDVVGKHFSDNFEIALVLLCCPKL